MGTLYTVLWHRGTAPQFEYAGIIMGLGVAAMHYAGMAAMTMPAVQEYNITLGVLSVVIAIVALTAALWLAFTLEDIRVKLASAVWMGGCGRGVAEAWHRAGHRGVTREDRAESIPPCSQVTEASPRQAAALAGIPSRRAFFLLSPWLLSLLASRDCALRAQAHNSL
jgi:hypothetical protein